MQISRHWRLSRERLRLEGVRYQNGDVSLIGGVQKNDNEVAVAKQEDITKRVNLTRIVIRT